MQVLKSPTEVDLPLENLVMSERASNSTRYDKIKNPVSKTAKKCDKNLPDFT